MKKRTLFLAMTALMITMTSGGSLTAVYADEIPTEAAETSESTELPIKPLTAKIVDENPYMAKSDSNIHHDCYNTDSTDEVLPVDIYSEINVSYEKTNPNASPAIFFDTYGHAVVPFLGGLAIRDINADETQTLGCFSPKQHDGGGYMIQSSDLPSFCIPDAVWYWKFLSLLSIQIPCFMSISCKKNGSFKISDFLLYFGNNCDSFFCPKCAINEIILHIYHN